MAGPTLTDVPWGSRWMDQSAGCGQSAGRRAVYTEGTCSLGDMIARSITLGQVLSAVELGVELYSRADARAEEGCSVFVSYQPRMTLVNER